MNLISTCEKLWIVDGWAHSHEYMDSTDCSRWLVKCKKEQTESWVEERWKQIWKKLMGTFDQNEFYKVLKEFKKYV